MSEERSSNLKKKGRSRGASLTVPGPEDVPRRRGRGHMRMRSDSGLDFLHQEDNDDIEPASLASHHRMASIDDLRSSSRSSSRRSTPKTRRKSNNSHSQSSLSLYELSQSVENISDIMAMPQPAHRLAMTRSFKGKRRSSQLNTMSDAVLYRDESMMYDTPDSASLSDLKSTSMVNLSHDSLTRYNALPSVQPGKVPSPSSTSKSKLREAFSREPSDEPTYSDDDYGDGRRSDPRHGEDDLKTPVNVNEGEPLHKVQSLPRFKRTLSGNLDVQAVLKSTEKKKLAPISPETQPTD